MAAADRAVPRWFFGPGPDLLLGCGFAYSLFAAVAAFAGSELRPLQPQFLFPFLSLVLSTPHYGATLLRVYERREDRRSYFLFSVWASLVIFAAFAAGVYVTSVGVFLVTLYLTWSPWHYTGQNYGIALLFLRRRGIAVDPTLKRLIYASFILSYGIVLLVLHASDGVASDVPVPYDRLGITFRPLGIPSAVTSVAIPALVIAYLASLTAWVTLLLRRSTLREIAPTLTLALTQALWFAIPYGLWHWGIATGIEPFERDQRVFYFLWIAMGHAVQYLWITTYYARRSEGYQGAVHYWSKTLLAGAGIWTIPVILFGPEVLGKRDYDGGLALLVTAAVNLHHFVLDGAIWKLRNHRIASILIRSAPIESEPAAASQRSTLSRRLVWGVAGACLAISFFIFWQSFAIAPSALARGDLPAAGRVLDRLAWFGHDSAEGRANLAREFEARGNVAGAVSQYERSIALRPTVDAYSALVRLRGQDRDWAGAAEVFEDALRKNPDDPELRFRAGVAWMRLEKPDRALADLERAAELDANNTRYRRKLEQVRLKLASAAPTNDPPSPTGPSASSR